MGHGASIASTPQSHWATAKKSVKLIHVKGNKVGRRKSRDSSTTNATDDDDVNSSPLPPGLHHAPPFLHHKAKSLSASSRGQRDPVRSFSDAITSPTKCAFAQLPPTHSLVDVQFRAEAYQCITDALEGDIKTALRHIRDRVGRERHVPQVRYFTTDINGVELVRCRLVDMPLEAFSRCIWGTFTSTMKHDEWSVQSLERLDDNTCYCRVQFDQGVATNVPLHLNVLLRLVRKRDRVVVVLRNIVEDNEYPLPPQSIRLLMNGWFVFDRDHQNTTLARTLVQCYATRTDNNFDEDDQVARANDPPHYNRPRKPWLRELVSRMFVAIDAANTGKLHVPPPETAALVVHKHSAALNGNYFESR
ncbi:hypothetical protein H310_08140 [Aphanomyces invadans]|uniref:START domain-containing protein n=1 Tax=Aphanomyces invadans TaxID=157072 RepID=A0A024U1J4_9STRA|nr:hypothetical protein H310_08140 [Aphanomyces invadans]ETV99457.1 hypothetical protein H310_08140 [Aphanomyces invadans]|eukprot:XP_008872013.1 hypothetical protein H310_08140 [Aphanomyces invadans]